MREPIWLTYLWDNGFAVATAVCLAAGLWGGKTERVFAATFWIAWALTIVVQSHGSKGPGGQVILIDSLVLVVFVAASVKSRRLWTIFATASQIDDVASHITARLLHFGLWSYLSAVGIWGGWFLIFCIAAGTIGYRLRLKTGTRSGTAAFAGSR